MPGDGTNKNMAPDREAQIKQVRALSAEEFLVVEIPEKEPIIDGLVHKRDLVGFGARRRHGKTSVMINMAVEGAVGAPDFLGYSIPKAFRSLLKRFSNRPCTTWGGRGTSAHTDAGGPMRAYSMDLRERALLDSDAGMKAADVAAKYRVSGSWVRLLKQRRRETGEVAPRVQRQGRRGMLEPPPAHLGRADCGATGSHAG